MTAGGEEQRSKTWGSTRESRARHNVHLISSFFHFSLLPSLCCYFPRSVSPLQFASSHHHHLLAAHSFVFFTGFYYYTTANAFSENYERTTLLFPINIKMEEPVLLLQGKRTSNVRAKWFTDSATLRHNQFKILIYRPHYFVTMRERQQQK